METVLRDRYPNFHDRRHPHPIPDRIRRPIRGRAVAAAGHLAAVLTHNTIQVPRTVWPVACINARLGVHSPSQKRCERVAAAPPFVYPTQLSS